VRNGPDDPNAHPGLARCDAVVEIPRQAHLNDDGAMGKPSARTSKTAYSGVRCRVPSVAPVARD